MLGPKGSWNTVIVPDSEDEREQLRGGGKSVLLDVIEISSDGDSDEEVKPELRKSTPSNLWAYRNPVQNISRKSPAVRTPAASSSKKGYGVKFMRSRVIESSDSDSDEKPSLPSTRSIQVVQAVNEDTGPSSPDIDHKRLLLRQTSSMVVEVDSDLEDDGAILVFDEPKSARKPMRQPPGPSHVTPDVSKRNSIPITLRDPLNAPQPETPQKKNVDLPTAPESSSPKKKASATQKATLKKRKEEQQAQLHTYAASLFSELNLTVFKNGLPLDTKLNWNKRLLTTAGRAKWHRSRDGVQTSEIELAEKILTSRERIRNTLSHEMCHLASWVIDKEIKEGHGRFWKAWTQRVMAKYPNIDISTRHDYEIEYPYKWKCAKCDKIYGRFSKSIKPDECVCGACKEGRLIPQFETNARAPKTPKMSRMAAAKPQGSPYTPSRKGCCPATPAKAEIILISSDSEADDNTEPTLSHSTALSCDIDSGSEDEIEVLALTLTATSI